MLNAKEFNIKKEELMEDELKNTLSTIAYKIDRGDSSFTVEYDGMFFTKKYRQAIILELVRHGFWCRWTLFGRIKWRTTRPLLCNLWYEPCSV